MTKASVLVKKQVEIDCVGKGETQAKAVEAAFRDMRNKVVHIVKEPIVSIVTSDVYLVKKETQIREEAFLFVFAKRKRELIEIHLKMALDVSYLKIE